jgi:hypothetical protein
MQSAVLHVVRFIRSLSLHRGNASLSIATRHLDLLSKLPVSTANWMLHLSEAIRDSSLVVAICKFGSEVEV